MTTQLVTVPINISKEAYEVAQRRVLYGKHRSISAYLSKNTEFYLIRKHDRTRPK